MSYKICKSIILKDTEKEVWRNNEEVCRDYENKVCRDYENEVCQYYGYYEAEKAMTEEEVLAGIGEDIFDGYLSDYRGIPQFSLFLQARETLPQGMSSRNFDSQTAGRYLAKAVMKLAENPNADLSKDVQALVALKDDKGYILDAAKRTGYSFLNEACEEVQKDRAFALEVMRACRDNTWAEYPRVYENDKAFALDCLALNGCHFRSLSPELRADRDVCLKWFEVGELYPYSVEEVPAEFLKEKKFQDVLRKRFEGTKMWFRFLAKIEEALWVLENPLAERLADAEVRSGNSKGGEMVGIEDERLFQDKGERIK